MVLDKRSLDTLTGLQHQQLLCCLCDNALDSPSLRDALQQRFDGSDDVKREMREAVAEKRGELKVAMLLNSHLLTPLAVLTLRRSISCALGIAELWPRRPRRPAVQTSLAVAPVDLQILAC